MKLTVAGIYIGDTACTDGDAILEVFRRWVEDCLR